MLSCGKDVANVQFPLTVGKVQLCEWHCECMDGRECGRGLIHSLEALCVFYGHFQLLLQLVVAPIGRQVNAVETTG